MQTDGAPHSRAVFKAIASAVGQMTKVTTYLDERERNSVHIAQFDDLPQPGLTSWATVTLHASPNDLEGQNIPVELMLIGRAGDDEVAAALSTCAFNVGKDQWLAAPGVVFPDVIAMYHPDTTVPHVLWSEPFIWPELSGFDVEGVGQVHCLLGIPVSDAEVDFLHEHGMDALEDAFEKADLDFPNLQRASVV